MNMSESTMKLMSLKSVHGEYHNRMSQEPDSQEYENFRNLLRRIVTVPRADIQKRMDEDKATKDWTRDNAQPEHRHRPIVSPGSVASSRSPKTSQGEY